MEHEKFCPHREVFCPSFRKNSCNWQGPLSHLIKHIKENKCVQVVFDKNWNNDEKEGFKTVPKFHSNLADFPSNTNSVFERSNVITHWKPVVLLAKGM